jgi:acyl transferase domain-containing protein
VCDECKGLYERAMAQSNQLNQVHLDELLYSFTVQYALGRLLMTMEINVAGIVAEGTGVLAAACLTGMLSIGQAAAMLCRYAQGQRELGDAIEPAGERGQAWNCPLLIPGAVLYPDKTSAISQLAGYLKSPRRLSATDASGITSDAICVHLGGSDDLRARLGIDRAGNWIGVEAHGPAERRLLASFARLYVRGVRFDPRPLKLHGTRRVPLPGYPFERKTYRCAPAALPEFESASAAVAATPAIERAGASNVTALRSAPPPAHAPELGARLSGTQRSALAESLMRELDRLAQPEFG